MKKHYRYIASIAGVVVLVLSACTSTANPVPSSSSSTPASTAAATTSPTTGAATPTAATTQSGGAAGNPTPAAQNSGSNGKIDCKGAKKGDTISMYYQWSGSEEANLNKILKPLVDACGIVLKPLSTRDQAVVESQVKAGSQPDVVFWQISTARQFVDKLKSLDKLGAHKENYSQSFIIQGTVNGKWLALPVKLDIKTIIWYSPAFFKAHGYTVPTTWDQLNTLVNKMASDHYVPWSMGLEAGPSTGWTGADFVEDILLVQKGPQYVQDIISGKVPYNDPGVKTAFQAYGKWARDPKFALGGTQGTLSTNFNTAIDDVFSDPPKALMVKQSGFASGEIMSKYPTLKAGSDYDFFGLPGAKGLQAGYDWMLAFNDTPAVRALVAYLSSKEGGANWAKAGFDLTPNKGGQGQYSDPGLKKKADFLAKAGTIVPSIGDMIPGGMDLAVWTAVVNYLNGQNLDNELANVAKAQAAAKGK